MNCVVIYIIIFISVIRCLILGIFPVYQIFEFITSLLLLPLFDFWYLTAS